MFFQNSYFSKKYPKSLDRNNFDDFFSIFLKKTMSLEDGLATLTSISVKCILNSIKSLPKKLESIIVCGGGYNNTFLIRGWYAKSVTTIAFQNLDRSILADNSLFF